MKTKVYLRPVDQNEVIVIFDFNWQIVETLRTLKSRRFLSATKENIISNDDAQLLMKKLPNFDYVHVPRDAETYRIQINRDDFSINPEPKIFNAKMSRLMYLKRPRDGYEVAKILKKSGYDVEISDNTEGGSLVFPDSPKLYEFQADGMGFLRANDYTGLVSLDMGLGKTILALRSIYELQKRPVLIVAPSSLLYQWKGEIEKHFGYYDSKVITAKTPKDRRLSEFQCGDIIITNYELLRTIDIERTWELLILDECQRVKNWKTKTAQAISRLPAKRVMGLSGTPVENNIMELYNITDQIKPAFFGTQKKFFNTYVKSNYGNRFTYKNLNQVYGKLQELMFRVNRNDVEVQLPKLIEKTYEVQLSKKELSFFWKYMAEQTNELTATTNAKVFASSSALRMSDIKVSSKEKELMNVIKDVNGQAIVFTQYKQELARLENLLTNKSIYSMSGDTNKRERDKAVNDFLMDEEGILLMTEVGTHGLNLQKANTLINMDLPWTFARKEQRIGRIQRIGSEHESNLVINLVSCGIRIDDRVMEIIDEKKALHDMSIDGTKKHVSRAFAKDLRERGITFGSE